MRTDMLEKHIIDTIKEWQMKIGYRKENIKLYYPDTSLTDLLKIEENRKLGEALRIFCKEAEPRLGEIKCSNNKERYCLEVSAEGCAYIAEEVPDPEFLKKFLAVITGKGNTMKQIQTCFSKFAKEKRIRYTESDKIDAGMGCVFYFEDGEADDYVYCVEENEFGLTYHRFTKDDYDKLSQKGIKQADEPLWRRQVLGKGE